MITVHESNSFVVRLTRIPTHEENIAPLHTSGEIVVTEKARRAVNE